MLSRRSVELSVEGGRQGDLLEELDNDGGCHGGNHSSCTSYPPNVLPPKGPPRCPPRPSSCPKEGGRMWQEPPHAWSTLVGRVCYSCNPRRALPARRRGCAQTWLANERQRREEA